MPSKYDAARLAAWLDAIGARNRSNLHYLIYKPSSYFISAEILYKMAASNDWTVQAGTWNEEELKKLKELPRFEHYDLPDFNRMVSIATHVLVQYK